MPLQLQAGKYYLSRDGIVYGPVVATELGVNTDDTGFPRQFPYAARERGHSEWEHYRADGSWGMKRGSPSSFDLVAECPAPVPTTLRLQAGKCYVTRSGVVVGPLEPRTAGPGRDEWAFSAEHPDGSVHCYRVDGSWDLHRRVSPHDLVAEYVGPATPPTPPAAAQLVAGFTALVSDELERRALEIASRFADGVAGLDKSALRTLDWSALSRVEPGVDFRLVLRDLIVAASRDNYLDEAFRDAHKTLQIPLAFAKPSA